MMKMKYARRGGKPNESIKLFEKCRNVRQLVAGKREGNGWSEAERERMSGIRSGRG